MQNLLELLKDGKSRTTEMMAVELGTTVEDVKRRMEYLENMSVIRKVPFTSAQKCNGNCTGCKECDGHGRSACKGCMPENAERNMGNLWEVV